MYIAILLYTLNNEHSRLRVKMRNSIWTVFSHSTKLVDCSRFDTYLLNLNTEFSGTGRASENSF